jgi:predicted bacteriocin transport accessory protein
MKKIALLALILGLSLSACSESKLMDSLSDGEGSKTEVTQVMPNYVVELFEAKSTFVFYAGASTCGACIFMKDVVSEVVERKSFPIYYVEINTAPSSQLNQLYLKIIRPQATPTYYFVVDGVVVKSFTPEVVVGNDTSLVEEHKDLYTVNFIALMKESGLVN